MDSASTCVHFKHWTVKETLSLGSTLYTGPVQRHRLQAIEEVTRLL